MMHSKMNCICGTHANKVNVEGASSMLTAKINVDKSFNNQLQLGLCDYKKNRLISIKNRL